MNENVQEPKLKECMRILILGLDACFDCIALNLESLCTGNRIRAMILNEEFPYEGIGGLMSMNVDPSPPITDKQRDA